MSKIDEVIKMVEEELFATEIKDNTNYFGYDCIINKDFDREKLLEVLKYAKQIEVRDTPMKVIIDELGEGRCPICNTHTLVHYVRKDKNFCNNCGQRLDWSSK